MDDRAGRLLARSNLSYRRPALYDAMMGDDGVVPAVVRLVGGSPAGILDLGCGTGRHLAALRDEFGAAAVGVDLQRQMVDYGRQRHGVDLRCGDLRSVRLGRRFELVTCLGNSLSYLRTDDDLRAAAETLRVHVEDRGIVVISTLTTPRTESVKQTVRVETELVAASVEVMSAWDAERRLQLTHRTWRHDDGTTDVDVLRRRVISVGELDQVLRRAGFTGIRWVGTGMVVATLGFDGG
ncbi:class I SAM-dependent methyltransferase [Kribbella sp. NPDC056345]|uniref:class I SAM-dependent methyltransferase n=1 Tax=Kribbella sp. NPDC056345 TaxID=3345789 RepID=UPI0035E034BE